MESEWKLFRYGIYILKKEIGINMKINKKEI
jgi:hypothetical protein